MIIAIEGPEKVGKSSTIKEVAYLLNSMGRKVTIRHWGKIDPDDRIYSDPLRADSAKDWGEVTIWDRGWASEHVYAKLLGRDRRLADDPWLGEWLHGRATQHRFMLTNSPKTLGQRRDETDLPVSPLDEVREFNSYCARFGWMLVSTFPKPRIVAAQIVRRVIVDEVARIQLDVPEAEFYVGPTRPKAVFVEMETDEIDFPGGWLPFSNEIPTQIGRALGDEAFSFGWAVAGERTRNIVRTAPTAIGIGPKAIAWIKELRDDFIGIPMPNTEKRITTMTKTLLEVLTRQK